MIQILQYQKTGEIRVDELPAPTLRPGYVVVRNAFSLISAGTERMSVETAQASLVRKARTRPDLVRQVLDNVKREGIVGTFAKVRDRLDSYKELGYSCAGVVVESGVEDIHVGDRVACAGAGYASHAEVVSVPRNLVARIPEGVSADDAAFTTVGAIAMQGVRQADIRVGEQVVVIGLGLLGLISVQLLKAAGCRVIGLDVSSRNFDLAQALGCDATAISNPAAVRDVEVFSRGCGADAVIITAATNSDEPVALAMQCVRKRGTVVVVGAVGMNISRSPFYEKEVNFKISCSYGPGRYDVEYEEGGLDYPLAFVRWTENRNMVAVLDLMAQGKLKVSALITHRIPIAESLRAYDIITGKIAEPYLGILIQYPGSADRGAGTRRIVVRAEATSKTGAAVLGFVGAGNFAQSMLLPPLVKLGPRMRSVATARPVNARNTAKKFGFEVCTTSASEVINDPAVNFVAIASRHDSHAEYVVQALRAGKHVFVEKPLAVTQEELELVLATYAEAERSERRPILMVGYNRRYSEPVREIGRLFAGRTEPLTMHYRVNAGYMPPTHWAQTADQGGRIIGEAGHFIDVLQYLCGAQPTSVYAIAPADPANRYRGDNVLISISFADGSAGTIHYFANGAPAVEKECVEVFGDGKIARMWNFQRVEIAVGQKLSKKSFSGDKGHAAEMKALVDAVQSGGQDLASIESLAATSRVTFAVAESIRTAAPVRL